MILDIWKEEPLVYLYFMLYTVSAALLPFFGIILPKLIIENLERNSDTTEIIKILIPYGIGFLVVGAVSFFTKALASKKMTQVRLNRMVNLTNIIMTCNYKYIEDSDFLDKNQNAFDATNGNNMGYEGALHILFALPASLIAILGYIFMVGNLNILILLYLLVNVVVNYIILTAVNKYQHKKKDKITYSNRRLNYFTNIAQDFSYGKDIRLNCMEENIMCRYDLELTSLLRIFRKIYNKQYRLSFIDVLFVLLREGIVYTFLIYSVLKNQLSIAELTMYLSVVSLLSMKLNDVINSIADYVGCNRYISDMYRFMNMDLFQNPGTLDMDLSTTKEIEFKNVSFQYPATNKYILTNFSLHIKKGEKLAIVGINGAGKTTVVKLLSGFFDEYEGEILVDGIEIRKFKRTEVYKLFSVVFQNFKIYSMTIAENVALDYENIDRERIKNVLIKVGLWNKISQFEKGLDQTLLKVLDPTGIELSGGENQKIAIARALYKDAPVIILDEPTASLDALAEAEIYENFNELIQNKTAIYISHRLSSTKFCDNIILMGDTGIVEYGTHEELLAKKGPYYEMFMVQAKYYQDGEEA